MLYPNLMLVLFTVLVTSAGQLLLKLAMMQEGQAATSSSLIQRATEFVFKSPYLWFGLLAYIAGFFLWLYVLKKVPLSTAYPFVGLGFPLVMITSALLLGEQINAAKIFGTGLICVGCIFVAQSS